MVLIYPHLLSYHFYKKYIKNNLILKEINLNNFNNERKINLLHTI